jgi:hypothetical protein
MDIGSGGNSALIEESGMLWNATGIEGYEIIASDGTIGCITDFLFDDASWTIRWLVIETGPWLVGRKLLLPTLAIGHLDPLARQCSVRLTRAQVEASPEIDSHQPVSRQIEAEIFDYYGWSPYWGSGFYLGGYRRLSDSVVHLRSVVAVTGFHIQARDGEIGHISDMLLQEEDWTIHFLVVDTKNWWPGKKVLVSPRWARKIDWAGNLVSLGLDRQRIKDSPAYDPAQTVDRSFERHFQSYYGDDLGTD